MAEKVIGSLNQVHASADVVTKIVKLNTDESDLIGQASTLQTSAKDLFRSLGDIKATQAKLAKAVEMHRAIDKIQKFLKDSEKGKDLPAKDKIIAQLVSLDQVNTQLIALPVKQEIEQITQISEKASDL